jgi:glycosyltransferase involved in cell wall biosynthesis
MKVLQVLNRRNSWGGEDHSVETTVQILKKYGHEAVLWSRDVAELGNGFRGKVRAFASGIYSLRSENEMADLINRERPDIIHVHNVYPQLSPSVLAACRKANVPVIWHPHDQRPICPTGLHLHSGQICEKCCGGREYWCVLQNCRNNLAESAAYAMRSAIHRRMRLFEKNYTLCVVWSEFLKQRLIAGGFNGTRIAVVDHPVSVPIDQEKTSSGDYVGYMGRISPEKGVKVLIEAARKLPDIEFRIAGDPSPMPSLSESKPANVKFIGWCDKNKVKQFYQHCRFIVIPSVCFEVFPTVAIEAMSFGLPVIGSRIGGIPEAIEAGITGALFEPGNSSDLANKIRSFWNDIDLCNQMGKMGRSRVIEKHSEEAYIVKLCAVYQNALKLSGN